MIMNLHVRTLSTKITMKMTIEGLQSASNVSKILYVSRKHKQIHTDEISCTKGSGFWRLFVALFYASSDLDS
jgi:hypothetical protein